VPVCAPRSATRWTRSSETRGEWGERIPGSHALRTGDGRGRAARERRPDEEQGEMTAAAILASARTQLADYLSTLIYVYTLLIILYIVVQLLFAAGLRPPYSRTTDAILGFLRDICEPYLRIFRRLLPSFGGIDFSPILAIILLGIFNSIVVQGIIHG
jgi:YggT family protein